MVKVTLALMTCTLLSAPLFGQTATDPLAGARKFGGRSAELLMITTGRANDSTVQRLYHYEQSTNTIRERFRFGSSGALKMGPGRQADIAVGDLDGDALDEVAAAWVGSDDSVRVMISPMNFLMPVWPGPLALNINCGKSIQNTNDLPYPNHIHVVVGDFDSDLQKELLVAFWATSEKLTLQAYKVSKSSSTGLLKAALTGVDTSFLISKSMGESARFDIAKGDFDGDQKHEVVVAATQFMSTSDFRVLVRIFDLSSAGITPKGANYAEGINPWPRGWWNIDEESQYERLAVTSGDFNKDGRDEVALAVQHRYGWWWDAGLFNGWWHFSVNVKHRVMLLYATPDLATLTKAGIASWETGQIDMLDLIVNRSYVRYPAGASALAAGDLNGDGRDELLWVRWSQMVLFTSNDALGLTLAPGISRYCESFNGDANTSLVAVADLDTAGSQPRLPEVVWADWSSGNRLVVSRPKVVGGAISDLEIVAQLTNLNANGQIAIAVGDFDGPSFSLGEPTRYTKPQFVQPTVIINAPPSHFDIIDGVTYDIPGVYTGGVSDLWIDYNGANSQSQTMQSTLTSDWGVSASVSGEVSYFGVGVKAGLSLSYGEQFSKDTTLKRSVDVTQTRKTWIDDGVYVLKLDYDLWEYPVYDSFGQVQKDKLLVVRPREPEKGWYGGKEEDATFFIPNHEVGNILSYVQYDSLRHNPEVGELITPGNFATVGTQGNNYFWGISQSTFGSGTSSTTRRFGVGVSASVSGWGLEVGVEGTYNASEITTLEASVLSQFGVGLNIGSYNLPGYSYSITPYLYWSKNGALVLDYSVAPDTTATGGYPTFWKEFYGAKSDPAFMLPWRYEPEKGNPMPEYLRNRTREITFDPPNPEMGDTVSITARIHNYSLKRTPGPVEVCFYLGDPQNGGTLLQSRDGKTKFTTLLPINPRGDASLRMNWAIPTNIVSNPKIYALIDPDNKIDDIHKTNNKAFAVLPLVGNVGVDPGSESDLPTAFALFQNYPNPFNPSTTIRYGLPNRSDVTLAIFNTLGQQVATLVKGEEEAGYHEVKFDAVGLSSGVYFYRITAGDNVAVKKLLLLK